jgi:hypothetical protein
VSIGLSSHEADPYLRIAAACFLQALTDYLTALRWATKRRQLTRRERQLAVDAVAWLRGETRDGMSLKVVAEALHVDISQLYSAPHESVATQVRLHMRGRRSNRDH